MINKLTFGLFTEQDTKSFMRLMAYVKPYKFRIIVALLAIIGVAITESYPQPLSPLWLTKDLLSLMVCRQSKTVRGWLLA